MAENEVKNPDLFNRSPGSQNLVEYFIKKKDSRISTRCLAVVNEEALAEFCRVVTLRSIKVDPYCEGEEPGDDGARRCLPGRVSQQSSTEPETDTRTLAVSLLTLTVSTWQSSCLSLQLPPRQVW